MRVNEIDLWDHDAFQRQEHHDFLARLLPEGIAAVLIAGTETNPSSDPAAIARTLGERPARRVGVVEALHEHPARVRPLRRWFAWLSAS